VMEAVIVGIKPGDQACIALGVDFMIRRSVVIGFENCTAFGKWTSVSAPKEPSFLNLFKSGIVVLP
jgi:hypothetical protein